MSRQKLKIVFMDKAREFISSLSEKIQKKITYNLLKVEGGEIDKELFKKIGKLRNMGISYIIQWSMLSTLCFLGHGN